MCGDKRWEDGKKYSRLDDDDWTLFINTLGSDAKLDNVLKATFSEHCIIVATLLS